MVKSKTSLHSNSSGKSTSQLCEEGINRFVAMQADAMNLIDTAIAQDKHCPLALLIKAWMLHGGRDPAAIKSIMNLISEVERIDLKRQSREWNLLTALKYTRCGDGLAAVKILDNWLAHSPTDLLVHQLAHEEIFWTGRADKMREVVERAAPYWDAQSEQYGAYLAIRAFANEEAGHLSDAERFGRMAVEIDPNDIWGAHAVAHVLYMQGKTQEGIRWLENLCQNWTNANQMRHHLWWHLCLFLLETGDHARVLELLTSEIRNPESSLVRNSPAAPIDIQNVASLLLRLELYGVNTGSHWDILSSICADRVQNLGSAFGSIHDMMVLAATGQYGAANTLLENMRSTYSSESGSTALSYNVVGIPVCMAILAHYRKDYSQVIRLLGQVRHDLPLIGASHAQRDIFYHILAFAAKQEDQGEFHAELVNEIEAIGFFDVPRRAAYRKQIH